MPRFTVERVSEDRIFPVDMLRRDRCYPASDKDSLAIGTTLLGPHEDRAQGRVRVTLVFDNHVGLADSRPEASRWLSHGWRVVKNNGEHPIPVGSKITSVLGEQDCDGDDKERHTGPNAAGYIQSVSFYGGAQGWSYSVHFPESGVWILIDQGDGIDDPTKYVVERPPVDPTVDEEDDGYPPNCTNSAGHEWVISEETDRSYCCYCLADGDA